jgi:hypothetical protein
LPQLHSFLSFIGQFLRVFLQLCLSAANEVVQIIATRIDIRIFIEFFMLCDSSAIVHLTPAEKFCCDIGRGECRREKR